MLEAPSSLAPVNSLCSLLAAVLSHSLHLNYFSLLSGKVPFVFMDGVRACFLWCPVASPVAFTACSVHGVAKSQTQLSDQHTSCWSPLKTRQSPCRQGHCHCPGVLSVWQGPWHIICWVRERWSKLSATYLSISATLWWENPLGRASWLRTDGRPKRGVLQLMFCLGCLSRRAWEKQIHCLYVWRGGLSGRAYRGTDSGRKKL